MGPASLHQHPQWRDARIMRPRRHHPPLHRSQPDRPSPAGWRGKHVKVHCTPTCARSGTFQCEGKSHKTRVCRACARARGLVVRPTLPMMSAGADFAGGGAMDVDVWEVAAGAAPSSSSRAATACTAATPQHNTRVHEPHRTLACTERLFAGTQQQQQQQPCALVKLME